MSSSNISSLCFSLILFFIYIYHQKCANVSACGKQSGSLRYGTSLCLSGCHAQPLPPACHQTSQQGCYHSLTHGNHSHALSHVNEHTPILNNTHNHNHAHNHISSQPVCNPKKLLLVEIVKSVSRKGAICKATFINKCYRITWAFWQVLPERWMRKC